MKLITEMDREELLELVREGLIKSIFGKETIDVVCSEDFYEDLYCKWLSQQRPQKPWYRKERW